MRQSTFASPRLGAATLLLSFAGLLAALAVAPRFAPAALAADEAQHLLSEEDVIAGMMDIEFNTRTNQDSSGDLLDNSPAQGVQDKYSFNLNVAKTTEFAGDITRQPNLYSKTLRRRKQGAAL